MTFEFYRVRFQFRAASRLYFPRYKSGNIVRGAFGGIFRRLVCRPDCLDAKTCETRAACPYAHIFEPRAASGEGPSGLADWPRPFVFRASHLDGRTVEPGGKFHFDVHLFEVRNPPIAYFERAFAELAREGLGSARVRADLESVDRLDLAGHPLGELAAPVSVDLSAAHDPVDHVRVRFATPTELKGGMAERPEFAILFGRLRDRIGTLRALYGAGPLEIDFRGMGERAAAVRMTRCDLQWIEAERRSSRSGQRHPLGGFVGEVDYAGDLREFLPYLRLGTWVGVGRQTVWGKGEIILINTEPTAFFSLK